MGVGRPIGVGSSLAAPMVVEGRRWGRSCGRRQALTQACAGGGGRRLGSAPVRATAAEEEAWAGPGGGLVSGDGGRGEQVGGSGWRRSRGGGRWRRSREALMDWAGPSCQF